MKGKSLFLVGINAAHLLHDNTRELVGFNILLKDTSVAGVIAIVGSFLVEGSSL